MVVVGDHHEAVPGVQFVFLPQDSGPDLLVELHRPFVGPRDDDQIVFAVLGVEVHQQVFQFLAITPAVVPDPVQNGEGGLGGLCR